MALLGLFNIELDGLLFERFSALSSFDDVSSLARFVFWKEAFNDFLASPILGAHFVNPRNQLFEYPHNQILEVGMSLGLIGMSLLLVIYGQFIWHLINGISKEYPLLVGLFVQAAVSAQFSGAIWGSSNFFIFGAMLIFVSKAKKGPSRKNKSKRQSTSFA
ncbi:hypothetical protein GCM10010417_54840 [Streptomyces carpaticus]